MQQRSIYFVIIATLVLIVGYLGYQVSQQGTAIDVQTQEIEEGNREREVLEFDLQKMRFSYDTLQIENSLMMAEMAAQRSEIEGLISKVRDRNYSVSKLKKETGTLRKIMQGYVVTIDSLNQANIALQMERDAMANQVTEVEERNADLRRRQDNMEGIIEAGRILQAMDLNPMAIRVASTGSQRETTRAKRAEMIKTCFTLMENRIAEKGERTLFLEVIHPDGRMLPPGDRSPVSMTDGSQASAARVLDYNGDRVEACIFFTAAAPFDAGVYTVHLVDGGERIAT
ncbi:MAG: hypothetical protein P8P45_02165, partial [Flavobacteriales bacterium]|nr:hypothetical protein [Flavobacteriales bacterium]